MSVNERNELSNTVMVITGAGRGIGKEIAKLASSVGAQVALLDINVENLNKTELGSLKALITQSAIKLRKAYGIFNESFVRRASFVGSVNEVEFLTDPTGNRRYLVVNCKDIEYLHNINMD